jgi:hypothetical protein
VSEPLALCPFCKAPLVEHGDDVGGGLLYGVVAVILCEHAPQGVVTITSGMIEE